MVIDTTSLDEIKGENELNFQSLTIDFFDRLENKTTKLISNDDPTHHLAGRHKLFPFYFKEANFVQSIEITLEGYSSSDKVEFYWISPTTGRSEISRQRVEGNKASISLNEIVYGFGFRPPKKYFKNPSIQKVEVTGLTLGNFSDACETIGNFTAVKNQVVADCDAAISKVEAKESTVANLKEEKDNLGNSITELSTEIEGLNSTIHDLTQSKAEITAELEETRSKETNLNVKIQSLEDSIDQKKNETSTLNSDIETRRSELSALKKDINQFPAEISGFVSQGGRNIWHYTILALIPILIILFVSLAVFKGAVDLTVKYSEIPTMDIITMLGSRLPFVLVTVGILTASYKLAKIFIAEIMRINRQRLNLSKVSIVAKDVSGSSVEGLDFTDEEKYELETKLKMDLLKSHLKGYVHDDYDHEINLGLLDRFKLQKKYQEKQNTASPDVTDEVVDDEE